ncbi:MAG: molybdopterin molybdotransferase MoeA [Thaumarchaeota archaeon]|jgi:molybdopterin biosynthesis enzyme|nr:molybdopterin molybdotransferase MoeA [Candidatus Geocrenenecus arthurdayi]
MPLEYRFRARPYDEALKSALQAFPQKAAYELVPASEALGRRIAEDIQAPFDMPRKNIAFYDGYAVRYEDTRGATASNPVKLLLVGSVLKDGEEIGLRVGRGEAVYLATSSPLPEGADAIVREEFTLRQGDYVLIKKEVELYEDVILRGEDARKGDVLISRGSVIRPQDQVLLLEIGLTRVKVYREPTIGIASVGDELLERFEKGIPYPDNYFFLVSSTLQLIGCKTVSIGILRDDPDEIVGFISKNISHYDALALIGGAARGVRDYTGMSVEKIGEVIFHATTLSPGKVSGVCKVDGKPVFLVPGHIGSATSCICNIIMPIISKIYYDGIGLLPKVLAKLTMPIEARPGLYTFRTVILEWGNDGLRATPHLKRLGGSTLITILSKAGGYILIPPGVKLSSGEIVEVTLLNPLEVFSWKLS